MPDISPEPLDSLTNCEAAAAARAIAAFDLATGPTGPARTVPHTPRPAPPSPPFAGADSRGREVNGHSHRMFC